MIVLCLSRGTWSFSYLSLTIRLLLACVSYSPINSDLNSYFVQILYIMLLEQLFKGTKKYFNKSCVYTYKF